MEISNCNLCILHKHRTNVVPGVGPQPCDVMVIGEGPGADEDKSGEPFIGRSGKLLTEWLESVNLIRNKNYFLTNIVKCRPPGNRNPQYDEMVTCGKTWLNDQVKNTNPKLIVTVGAVATQFILKEDRAVSKLVGQVFHLQKFNIFPIYHPAFILRQPKIQEIVDEHLNFLAELIVGIRNE